VVQQLTFSPHKEFFADQIAKWETGRPCAGPPPFGFPARCVMHGRRGTRPAPPLMSTGRMFSILPLDFFVNIHFVLLTPLEAPSLLIEW